MPKLTTRNWNTKAEPKRTNEHNLGKSLHYSSWYQATIPKLGNPNVQIGIHCYSSANLANDKELLEILISMYQIYTEHEL